MTACWPTPVAVAWCSCSISSNCFFDGGYAPYPLTVGGPSLRQARRPVVHDRVTDETAPVRLLAPADPVMLLPNRLGNADWQGWVQERGLYFARTWHPAYRPLLETHDPGDPPLEGGLLVAKVGQGTYVYTGLSFFRQLPAGVPGRSGCSRTCWRWRGRRGSRHGPASLRSG